MVVGLRCSMCGKYKLPRFFYRRRQPPLCHSCGRYTSKSDGVEFNRWKSLNKPVSSDLKSWIKYIRKNFNELTVFSNQRFLDVIKSIKNCMECGNKLTYNLYEMGEDNFAHILPKSENEIFSLNNLAIVCSICFKRHNRNL